jgi:hypothetical protein
LLTLHGTENSLKVSSVAVELQQWVSFALLPNYKIFHTALNNINVLRCSVGWDSSVDIATGYGLDGPGSNPGGGEISDILLEYKRNWIQHVNRMPHNRLPRVMKHYSPTGRRNHGRPLKRLLDT